MDVQEQRNDRLSSQTTQQPSWRTQPSERQQNKIGQARYPAPTAW